LLSCSKKQERIVIWTDNKEIVSYVELFNVEQDDVKAIIVYKDQIATALPPAKDEGTPDIIIGSLLKDSKTKDNFISLNGILGTKNKKGEISNKKIDKTIFYEPLLEYGKFKEDDKQYLLPVSFNLPIMIFSNENEKLINHPYIIEFDDIRDSAEKFNVKNKHNIYTKMGFAPSWNPTFIYTLAKMNEADFHEEAKTFLWNEENLQSTIDYIKKWSSEKNTSTTAEKDFSFKYLYTPSYKQISSGRCLFAYSTTDEFFSLAQEQIDNIDFRWLIKNGMIYTEDDITSIGIYKESKKKSYSKIFVRWLLKDETQKSLLERSSKMHLGTQSFGICEGFSSIRSVNERYFPTYYKNLLGNLPSEKLIKSPYSLPPKWNSLKERVLIPYLSESTTTQEVKKLKSIEDRLKDWSKQFN